MAKEVATKEEKVNVKKIEDNLKKYVDSEIDKTSKKYLREKNRKISQGSVNCFRNGRVESLSFVTYI